MTMKVNVRDILEKKNIMNKVGHVCKTRGQLCILSLVLIELYWY